MILHNLWSGLVIARGWLVAGRPRWFYSLYLNQNQNFTIFNHTFNFYVHKNRQMWNDVRYVSR